MVTRSAVSVDTSLGQSMRLPPTVSWVQHFSFFFFFAIDGCACTCDFVVMWDLTERDEENGVGAINFLAITLG